MAKRFGPNRIDLFISRETSMPIKVVVEFRAKPGARAELKSLLADISATFGPTATGAYAPVIELVAAPFRATRIGQTS